MEIGRGAREPENGAVRDGDGDTAQRRGASHAITNDAVPVGPRAVAADVEIAGGGRTVALPADVITVDGQDRAVLKVVRQGALIAAFHLVDVGVDGDRIETRETGRAVVGDDDRLADRQAGGIRGEDGTVIEHQAAEDDLMAGGDDTIGAEIEGGGATDGGDDIAVADARSVDVGADGETGGVTGRQIDGDRIGDGGHDTSVVRAQAHGGGGSKTERTTVEAGRASVSVGAGQHPDALVGLEDTERLRGGRIRQDGGDGVEVGVDAAQLEHAVVGRSEGRQRRRRVGIDDVRQGQRTGAAGLDAAAAGGAGEVDRTGRDFARTGIGQGDGIATARIAELEPAAGRIGTERRGRGAGGADGGNDELLVT